MRSGHSQRLSTSGLKALDNDLHLPSIGITCKDQDRCSPAKTAKRVQLPTLAQTKLTPAQQQGTGSTPSASQSLERRKRSLSRPQLHREQRTFRGAPSSVNSLPTLLPCELHEAEPKAARHRRVLRDAAEPCQHTQAEAQRVVRTPEEYCAVARLISAEARRFHQQRKSFQEREKVLDVLRTAQGRELNEPTIWQLHQCSSILREAVQDIIIAMRIVRKAVKRSKGRKLLQSKWPELKAMAALTSHLTKNRNSDVAWKELLDSVQSPAGSNSLR